MLSYAELHAHSAFSFRKSVASPQSLVEKAHALGYRAIALTDEVSLAGVVRAHEAAKKQKMHLIVGSQCHWQDDILPGPIELVFLVCTQKGYSNLCRLIGQARRRAPKGKYELRASDFDLELSGLSVIWKPSRDINPDTLHALATWLKKRFGQSLWLGVTRILCNQEQTWLDLIEKIGQTHGLPVVACGDVCMCTREDKPLMDVMEALHRHTTVQSLGLASQANAERHLRPISTLAKLYPKDWLDETIRIAEQCTFSMDQLSYRHPKELVPATLTPSEHLRQLTEQGLKERYGDTIPHSTQAAIEHELQLIGEMGVEAFFLTVHDLVAFAKRQGILCQGRGSAANSAVCYCLGITEVDPAKQSLLFERFLSKERDEPPDIDVDFEHERREEVLQYIYQKYGRERAGLAATVITYRPKSALKDAGRALGIESQILDRLTQSLTWWDKPQDWPDRLQACGLDPADPISEWLLALTHQLIGLPRHLSQHVGGMVISDQPLHHLVPIENAAMADRTIIQWDKDDLETLGLLKVDCLALGMLTVLRKAMQSIDPNMTLADIPKEDPATYEMLCRGDAIGVFQVESRAQMAMLPRLQPRCFYDLVIEIAIVRPGPIQGDMVHPYLQRRSNPQKVTYPNQQLEGVLRRTLGVPIFQEQVMQIAMVAAGFGPGQADQLRRAMAAWKRRGGLEPFREKLIQGMLNNGYSEQFAMRIYQQIQGFGDYGFPESHAASFALLTYFSAWLKCHHPASFVCALLNSQPMGFYQPAQLIHDAKRSGVEILPVDIHQSLWDCHLVSEPQKSPKIRLGLNQIKGLSCQTANRLIDERSFGTYQDIASLVERAKLPRHELRALSRSGALDLLTKDRRQTHWQALAACAQGDLLANASIKEPCAVLGKTPDAQLLREDYDTLGYSLTQHPIAYLRPSLSTMVLRSDQLHKAPPNKGPIEVIGLVTHRQRPGTASGVVFLSLEDETGIINVIVWPKVAMAHRVAVTQGQVLQIKGRWQQRDGSVHIIAHSITAKDQELAEQMG